MEKTTAEIRLLLASFKLKDQDLESQSRQFRRQLSRATSYAVRSGGSVDSALAIMNEIQERLDDVEQTRRHLTAIRERAEEELHALTLTTRIEAAKDELKKLKARHAVGELDEEARDEIAELERFIEQASLQAGQAIAERRPQTLGP